MGTLLQVNHPACSTTPKEPAPLTPPPTRRFERGPSLPESETSSRLSKLRCSTPCSVTLVRQGKVQLRGGGLWRRAATDPAGASRGRGGAVRTGKKVGVIDILRKYGKPGEAEVVAMRLQINTDHASEQTPSVTGPPTPADRLGQQLADGTRARAVQVTAKAAQAAPMGPPHHTRASREKPERPIGGGKARRSVA